MIAIVFLPISIFQLLFQMSGFWSAILAYFIFRDHMSGKEISLMVLGFLGVMVVLLFDGGAEEGDNTHYQYLLGIFVSLLASFFMACIFVAIRAM